MAPIHAAAFPTLLPVFGAEGGQASTPKISLQILTWLNFHLLQELPQG